MQCSLFDIKKEVEEELQKQVEENVEELTVYRKKNKRKTVAGIKKEQLKNTEIEIIEYKINPEEKCPECESELNDLEGITHAECWAHARRYFYESIPLLENKKMNTEATSYIGLTYCDKLFK